MKMRIEEAPDGLYEEIVELCTRRGAVVHKSTKDKDIICISETSDGKYKLTNNGYIDESLNEVMKAGFITFGIRNWTVSNEDSVLLKGVN